MGTNPDKWSRPLTLVPSSDEALTKRRPHLVVAKGTFRTLGGAERDLLNNLNALNEIFKVTLLTLHPPTPAEMSAAGVEHIPSLFPDPPWNQPTGPFAEIMARGSRSSTKAWSALMSDSEVNDVMSDAEAIHLVSGPGSLELINALPHSIPIHLHMLEPHRGLYEDVLHRTIDGTLNRPMWLTSGLLSKQRRRDQHLVRMIIDAGGLISGNSPWIVERIREIYGAEATLLPHSIDTSEWTLEPTPEEINVWKDLSTTHGLSEDGYVVTVGRASWVKGTWETLSMLESTPFSLAHIGGGDTEDIMELESHAASLAVPYHPLPRLSQSEMLAVFRHARAMVSHAHHEPMGLTPIEAHACGTPVIVVDEGGFRMTTEDGVSGRLISRDAPVSEWHSSLEQAGDSDYRQMWSAAGRSRVEAIGMSPIDHARRIHDWLKPLLATTKPS